MRTPHPDPRPTAMAGPTTPRPRALPLGGLRAAHPPGWLARSPSPRCSSPAAPMTSPPTARRSRTPEVLTVAAAAGNPCAARRGESGALALLVVLPRQAEGDR